MDPCLDPAMEGTGQQQCWLPSWVLCVLLVHAVIQITIQSTSTIHMVWQWCLQGRQKGSQHHDATCLPDVVHITKYGNKFHMFEDCASLAKSTHTSVALCSHCRRRTERPDGHR